MPGEFLQRTPGQLTLAGMMRRLEYAESTLWPHPMPVQQRPADLQLPRALVMTSDTRRPRLRQSASPPAAPAAY